MKNRFIDIEKYNQKWFRDLSARSKFFYEYLHNRVDNAGFLDIIPEQIKLEINLKEDDQQNALEELKDHVILSDDRNTIYFKEFLTIQGNLPLNHHNGAHKNIIKICAERLQGFQNNIEFFAGIRCHHKKVFGSGKDKQTIENLEESLLDTLKCFSPMNKEYYTINIDTKVGL